MKDCNSDLKVIQHGRWMLATILAFFALGYFTQWWLPIGAFFVLVGVGLIWLKNNLVGLVSVWARIPTQNDAVAGRGIGSGTFLNRARVVSADILMSPI